MRKLFVLLFLLAGFAMACNNSSETPAATAAVDSATKAASDTLRPSADTTSKKADMMTSPATKTADTTGKRGL